DSINPSLNSGEVGAMNSLHLEEARDILEKKTLTRAEKRDEITKLIHRATSSGDAETIRALLNYQILWMSLLMSMPVMRKAPLH
ncbi:hypothetical protein L0F63_003730, partial [Massospora cicadina]